MNKKIYIALSMAFLAATVMGMSDGALGVAWPAIRADMGLPLEGATVLIITSAVFYTLASSQSGGLFNFMALEKVVVAGITSVVLGFTGYIFGPSFAFLAVATAFVGAGTGLIDSGVNFYLAKSFTSRHMNWMHSFWGLGASISPVLMTQMILIFSWRMGYGAMAAFQTVALAVIIVSVWRGVWKTEGPGEKAEEGAGTQKAPKTYLTKKRHGFMQLLLFFIQAGLEGAIFFWIVSIMQDSRGLDVASSGMFPTAYFAAIVAGRAAFGYFAKYLSNTAIIRIGLGIAAAGLAALIFLSSPIIMFAVGFGLAPVFPCLMHQTKMRFAPHILSKLVGRQIAAAGAGVAIISPAMGLVLSAISLEALFPLSIGLIALVFVVNEKLAAAQ